MRPPANCQLIILMLTSINCESTGESSHLFTHHRPDYNVGKGVRGKRNSPQPRNCSVVLHSPRVTNWGSWLDYFSTCPSETFVLGIQLKTDPFHGNHNNGGKADNTGLNGIKFLCGNPTARAGNEDVKAPPRILRNITNQVQKWGKWGKLYMCRKGQVGIGFQLRVRKALSDGLGYGFKMDDVATCNMRLICSDGQVLEGDGRNEWGEWTKKQICPKRHSICSLKTQVEADQFIFDDTALNNVDVGCCPLKEGGDQPSVMNHPQSFHNRPKNTASVDLIVGGSHPNQNHGTSSDKASDSAFDTPKIRQGGKSGKVKQNPNFCPPAMSTIPNRMSNPSP